MARAKRSTIPQCFISYSWDSEPHKDWVRTLADRLQRSGVSIVLDQWDVHPGSDLTRFMNHSLKDSDFVILVCTPQFAKKADAGKGGVGYETTIVTGEIYTQTASEKKFIPILREGEPRNALPSYLKSRAYVDFREPGKFDQGLEELLRHIHGTPKYVKPKLGEPPDFGAKPGSGTPRASSGARTARARRTPEVSFDQNLFLNVPLDSKYQPLLQAAAFTVLQCGLNPRSPLELADSGSIRIDRILTLVSVCKYSIHDISRSGRRELPSLNTPLELGIYLGAMRFDREAPAKRSALILDAEAYRYQRILSDLAGFDIRYHENEPRQLVQAIGGWLGLAVPQNLPSPGSIWKNYNEFQTIVPKNSAGFSYDTFVALAKEWLTGKIPSS